eukprot:CAMPEP_0176494400 /NCGR_PEP_ID=MMETSP0200_2-20121128/10074_1 /TAXON_ID=947934 /ORGANISM="Chaetoceros sp., Strain GSL56" /LENGTH=372 /DNA_ID=CAMNT_0017892151 /DNA_START=147 /DNA_END=1265 /DNA_ORIENTATION=-
MNLSHFFVIALAMFATVPGGVWAGENKNKNQQDDDGFFYFENSHDWSQSAIYPMSCIETKNGDAVVYSLYNKNHNQCKRNQMGTYKMSVENFIRAYMKQVQKEYENNGNEYQVNGETMAYLQCQQYYYNNNLYYMKVGCRNTGKGFQVQAYTDMYCTQKATMNYNMGVDISSLRVSFETCKACVASSSYNQYNNQYNNNNNQNQYNNYYGSGVTNQHDSMLCASADNYKETCNRACRRAARKVSSTSSRSALSGEGFSAVGKFFLWVLSLSAVFFLLAALAQRKKMSKQDAMIEDAAIKSSGVDKKYIPRIFIGFIFFIIVLILLKKKALTWFFLIAINIALLGYWMHLKKKAEQNAAVSGFQLYGDGGTPA